MDIPTELIELIREFGYMGFWLIVVYQILEFLEFPVGIALIYWVLKGPCKWFATQIEKGNF